MSLKFTKKDLKNNAGSSVFGRGMRYFENDAVGKIKTVADKYIAKVHGRNVYTVQYSPGENRFSCNCPYGGFCKHLVAFGLKLLEEKDNLGTVKNFDEWYASINNEVKLRFLERLVSEDVGLKENLDKFNKRASQDDKVETKDVAEAVFHMLKNLSWEDVLDNQDHYDYYVDEFDVMNDMIENALDDHYSEIDEMARNGRIEEAFDYILGLYLGLRNSVETEIAEYMDDLESYSGESLDKFSETLKLQNDASKTKILNRFIAFCNENHIHNFHSFESFLMVYITEKHVDLLKEFLLEYREEYPVNKILMMIAEMNGDVGLMEKTLRDNSQASLYIPYLKILKANGEIDKIKQTLLRLSKKDDICQFEQFITPELGDETYKNFLLQLITKCFKTRYYKIYKGLVDENQKNAFIAGIEKKLSYRNERFALPLLVEEKLYEPVVAYIRERVRGEFGFDSYEAFLDEISKKMPGEVWDIYFKKVNHLFSLRKRNDYTTMAYYLKKMKTINKEKTEQLIFTYYNHKPVLRALKDEFVKAGIV